MHKNTKEALYPVLFFIVGISILGSILYLADTSDKNKWKEINSKCAQMCGADKQVILCEYTDPYYIKKTHLIAVCNKQGTEDFNVVDAKN